MLPDTDYTISYIEEKLQNFATLEKNWDSYGAPPLSEYVIDRARRILIMGLAFDLPRPFVSPGADGGIGIEWDTPTVELYVDVQPFDEPDGYLLTLNVDTAKQIDIDEDLTDENIVQVFNRFKQELVRCS